MADIIERLRIESQREPNKPIWRDAVDEIEALRAEASAVKESLSTDLRAMRAERERAMEARQLISDDLATAESHAERLAEAISAYKSECDNPAKDYVLRAKRRDEMFALLRDQEEGK